MLYNLVTLKTQLLKALDVNPVVEQLVNLRTCLSSLKTLQLTIEQTNYVNDLLTHYNHVIDLTNKPVVECAAYIEKINIEINEITNRLFAGNYQLENMPGSVDFVRNSRRILGPGQFSDDTPHIARQKIATHTKWQYPALEIGCRDGEWTQYLVAADPLYIMDFHQEFLDSTAERFPVEYQHRLRRYRIIDHDLTILPQGQFGFIFSWGYFNYVSVDTMKRSLKQIHTLLRPGGTFIFTYNNGDAPIGAGMAENFSQTYMPRSLLVPLVDSFDFTIVDESDVDSSIMWLEIKKPGELHTIKAHQVLGEIKYQEDSLTALTEFTRTVTI